MRDGLRFYRAEPVPAHWGSLDWPDNYFGGRWGPPYALLQGSLRPRNTRVRPASGDVGPGAKPVIRRGMLAWAGGGGGPDFFIALARACSPYAHPLSGAELSWAGLHALIWTTPEWPANCLTLNRLFPIVSQSIRNGGTATRSSRRSSQLIWL